MDVWDDLSLSHTHTHTHTHSRSLAHSLTHSEQPPFEIVDYHVDVWDDRPNQYGRAGNARATVKLRVAPETVNRYVRSPTPLSLSISLSLLLSCSCSFSPPLPSYLPLARSLSLSLSHTHKHILSGKLAFGERVVLHRVDR